MNGTGSDVQDLLALVAGDATAEHDAGGYWVYLPDLDVRAMARQLLDREVRLVTITARPESLPDDEEHDENGNEDEDGNDDENGNDDYRLIYHWDLGRTVLNVGTTVTAPHAGPTIADLIPGADWAEREIRDYYELDFTGRPQTRTLMLREGDPAGLFSRTRTAGRDADPATTALRAAAAPEHEEGEAR